MYVQMYPMASSDNALNAYSFSLSALTTNEIVTSSVPILEGVSRAADIVEQVISSGRPVL
jgi:hypothetical protein